MLLRVVLFLGVLLVLVAGGAAGWQYWQSLPQAVASGDAEAAGPVSAAPILTATAPAATAPRADQTWLISKGGGLVPRDDARNFLAQHRFVESRDLRMTYRLPLAALLSEGEVLPAEIYRTAFAAVRANAAATRLCAPLLQAWAEGCAVHSAKVLEDTYDPASESAVFAVAIAFSLKPDAQPLPDLAARSLITEVWWFDADRAGAAAATPEGFLSFAVNAAGVACSETDPKGDACRVMRMNVDWSSPQDARAQAQIGKLVALPTGVFPAPPLF